MNHNLHQILEIAAKALEVEDQSIRGAIAANVEAYPSQVGGILRIYNEQYFQFIIARACIESFQFPVVPEADKRDLVFHYPGCPNKWFATVEMKCWRSDSGNVEIPSILRDISTKLAASPAEHNLMMLFSANQKGRTEENLKWLSEQLGIPYAADLRPWAHFQFDTVNPRGEEVEFWVAGYEVPRQ